MSANASGGLSDYVERSIESAIASGVYTAGEKLPTEAELCYQFSVSRITVREALQRLRARGLTRSEQGRGTFVLQKATNGPAPFGRGLSLDNIDDVEELFVAREVIERACVELACGAPESERARLEAIISEAERLHRNPLGRAEVEIEDAALHLRFHRTLGDLTGNTVLADLLEQSVRLVSPVWFRTMGDSTQPDPWWDQHAEIARAVRLGDRELAAHAVTRHVRAVGRSVAEGTPDSAPRQTTPAESAT